MAVTANRFQTSKAGCVEAQRGEDALFCNIDFILSCRLRCSVGSNRSAPGKQIQCSRERLRADGKQSYAMGQARRAEIASRLERHQSPLGQANVELSITQSQIASETSKRQRTPRAHRLGPIVVEDGLQRTVTTIRDKRLLL